ncbi:unnamed protein product [Gongylonema pulchrum]|uniref:Secreted protein n=1 Tax=Gongylonema pulchrum TaxID=637853 RepID=A0A183DGN7_9BILA|nr:unnamed protein product [Gongylonema pulchrum]
MGLGLGLGVAAMAQMRTNETPSLVAQNLPQTHRYDTTNLAGGTTVVESGDRRYGGGSSSGHNDISKVQSFFYR